MKYMVDVDEESVQLLSSVLHNQIAMLKTNGSLTPSGAHLSKKKLNDIIAKLKAICMKLETCHLRK